jgi:5-methylcytosine-specific restriction endonuclease McrA
MTTLVLNADAQPVSLLPLSTVDWQEAIRYLVLDKVTVMSWYDDWIVHSARWSTRVPAVIMLKEYQKPKTTIRFSRANVYLRDKYTCQYCETKVNGKTATLDHVLPVSKGGKTTFDNTVCACGPCNASKGANHRIKPKIKPYKPEYYELVNKRKSLPFHVRHDSWLDYIKV